MSTSSTDHQATPDRGHTPERLEPQPQREPLAPLPTNANHASPSICADSRTSSTLEPSYERFSTFINDDKLAVLSKGIAIYHALTVMIQIALYLLAVLSCKY